MSVYGNERITELENRLIAQRAIIDALRTKVGNNYGPGDDISPRLAFHDLRLDFIRIGHAATDIFVNLARIAGVSDRDDSQTVGRILLAGMVVWAIAEALI